MRTGSSAAQELLAQAALPARGQLIDGAAAYLHRTRLGRWCGLIAGLALGIGPLAGDNVLQLAMPRILAGYLLGLLVSELLTPRGPRRARRSATLTARRAADLLPRWARTAVRLLFLPAFAAPLLMLSQPVHGLAAVSSPGWTCSSALPGWPQLAQLPVLVAAAIGVAGLAVAEVTWRRLARRPRPADDLDVARLDDVVRGMSARAVAGGAAALALTLTAMITQAVVIEGHVLRCPPHPGGFLIAYPWAARMASGLELTAPALLIAALVVMGVCWRRQDPRHQASASAAS